MREERDFEDKKSHAMKRMVENCPFLFWWWYTTVGSSIPMGSPKLLNSSPHSHHFLPNILQHTPTGDRPKLMQRSRIGIQIMQNPHHHHRAHKHRNRAENPQQQRHRKVESSHSSRPEIASHDHRLLHVARGNFGVRHCEQEGCVDEAARCLDEGSEGDEEEDEKSDVFDRHDGLACVAVNEVGCEDGFCGGSEPCSD
ncbi:unnamed protein product [Camellia sinensis]